MISIRPKKHVALSRVSRLVGTTGGTVKVTDYAGAPASGRVVLLLRRDIAGVWYLADSTTTDSNGDYAFSVASGPSEQLLVVCLGDLDLGERSVALYGIVGVE